MKQQETKSGTRADIRFEREAKALQKNLEKRKQQQKKREELKKAKQERQN